MRNRGHARRRTRFATPRVADKPRDDHSPTCATQGHARHKLKQLVESRAMKGYAHCEAWRDVRPSTTQGHVRGWGTCDVQPWATKANARREKTRRRSSVTKCQELQKATGDMPRARLRANRRKVTPCAMYRDAQREAIRNTGSRATRNDHARTYAAQGHSRHKQRA